MWSRLLFAFIAVLLNLNIQGQDLLNEQLNYESKNTSIEESLHLLSDLTGMNIAFTSEQLDGFPLVNVSFRKASLSNILTHILLGTDLSFTEQNGQILVFKRKKSLPTHTISGYVEDRKSGERLIGANVFDFVSKNGTATNEYGFFSLTLDQNYVDLSISYLGYQHVSKKTALIQDLNQVFKLKRNLTLQEIIVIASDSLKKIDNPGALNRENIEMTKVSSLPTLGGEADIMRIVDLLPGVQTGADGIGGIHVRGGNGDQNLILLDGVPVYNVSHALGIFSVFNEYGLKKADLHKGSFSAKHGGRVSSVLDIKMREGNKKEYKGGAGIGLLSSKLYFEGPIQKEKSSFMISARRTYFDLLIRPFTNLILDEEGNENYFGYYFYDWNAKMNFELSKKDKLFVSLFNAADNFRVSTSSENNQNTDNDEFRVNWRNAIAAVRWNHLINNKTFSNTTLSFSLFDFNNKTLESFGIEKAPLSEYESLSYTKLQSRISDFALNSDFDYYHSPQHTIKFGLSAINHSFGTALGDLNQESSQLDSSHVEAEDLLEFFPLENNYAFEASLYGEDQYRVNDRWRIHAGINLSSFFIQEKLYAVLQPRVNILYFPSKKWSIHASANRMTQYLHVVSSTNAGLPSDLWVPSTKQIKPQDGFQVSSGFEYQLSDQYLLKTDVYFKRMFNLINFFSDQENAINAQLDSWETKVTQGQGRAYGMEISLKKEIGKSTGWLNYTLSWADRKFDKINSAEMFPFKYDRRHYIKMAFSHQFNDRISLNANGVFGTGNPFTLQTGVFNYNNSTFYDYSSKNQVRLPNYHRIDLGVSFKKQKLYGLRTWNISLYNAYNHKNTSFAFLETSYVNNTEVKQWKKLSLFPILPSVNYSLLF